MTQDATPGRRVLGGQVFRFLIVGGLNTLVSNAIFVLLALVMPPAVAYAIAFGLGLAWSVFGSSRFVFRSHFSWKRAAAYTAWYLAIFGLGQLVILAIGPREPWELILTSLALIAVTTPLTFVGARFVFKPRATTPVAAEEKGEPQ